MATYTKEIPQHEQVFEVIKAIPGCRVADIAQLVDFRRESISARLTQLKREGRVKYEDGKYYPGDGTPQIIIPKKLRMPKEKVEKMTMGQKIEALSQQLAELLAWQEAAIQRHPDLGVRPEVLAARQVAMNYYHRRADPKMVSEIKAGKHDDAPFMHMILAAMA